MSAVTVKTTCQACGDIQIDLDALYVSATRQTYYFVHCDLPHERSGPKAVDVLTAAGALVVDLTKLDDELRSLL